MDEFVDEELELDEVDATGAGNEEYRDEDDIDIDDIISSVNSLMTPEVVAVLAKAGIKPEQVIADLENGDTQIDFNENESIEDYARKFLRIFLYNKINRTLFKRYSANQDTSIEIQDEDIKRFSEEYLKAYQIGSISDMLNLATEFSISPVIYENFDVGCHPMTPAQKEEYRKIVGQYQKKLEAELSKVVIEPEVGEDVVETEEQAQNQEEFLGEENEVAFVEQDGTPETPNASKITLSPEDFISHQVVEAPNSVVSTPPSSNGISTADMKAGIAGVAKKEVSEVSGLTRLGNVANSIVQERSAELGIDDKQKANQRPKEEPVQDNDDKIR